MADDPLLSTMLQKATSIGAPNVGTRYVPSENPSLIEMLSNAIVGPGRPQTVVSQDPYGIQGWLKGAGQPPGLMMGSTTEAAPTSLVRNLLKYSKEPLGDAAGTLINQLGQKLSKPTPTIESSSYPRIPNPTSRPGIFMNLLDRVPEAKGQLENGLTGNLSRAPGLNTGYQKQAAFRNKMKDIVPPSIRPSVTSIDQLGDIKGPSTNISLPSDTFVPPITRDLNSNVKGSLNSIFKKSGLTPEMVRDIRGLTKEEAVAKYPNVKPNSIHGIIHDGAWKKIVP